MAKDPVNRETENEKPKQAAPLVEGVNEVNFEESRRVVDEQQKKLSEANEEGHEKNMKAIEEAVKDTEQGKPDPKLGREDNGNTPRVNKDGSKSWFPPSVAGSSAA